MKQEFAVETQGKKSLVFKETLTTRDITQKLAIQLNDHNCNAQDTIPNHLMYEQQTGQNEFPREKKI